MSYQIAQRQASPIIETVLNVETYCSTCVQMTENMRDMEQELIRLRTRDKVLATSNRVLRRRLTALQDQADALFLALCEDDKSLVSEETT